MHVFKTVKSLYSYFAQGAWWMHSDDDSAAVQPVLPGRPKRRADRTSPIRIRLPSRTRTHLSPRPQYVTLQIQCCKINFYKSRKWHLTQNYCDCSSVTILKWLFKSFGFTRDGYKVQKRVLLQGIERPTFSSVIIISPMQLWKVPVSYNRLPVTYNDYDWIQNK